MSFQAFRTMMLLSVLAGGTVSLSSFLYKAHAMARGGNTLGKAYVARTLRAGPASQALADKINLLRTYPHKHGLPGFLESGMRNLDLNRPLDNAIVHEMEKDLPREFLSGREGDWQRLASAIAEGTVKGLHSKSDEDLFAANMLTTFEDARRKASRVLNPKIQEIVVVVQLYIEENGVDEAVKETREHLRGAGFLRNLDVSATVGSDARKWRRLFEGLDWGVKSNLTLETRSEEKIEPKTPYPPSSASYEFEAGVDYSERALEVFHGFVNDLREKNPYQNTLIVESVDEISTGEEGGSAIIFKGGLVSFPSQDFQIIFDAKEGRVIEAAGLFPGMGVVGGPTVEEVVRKYVAKLEGTSRDETISEVMFTPLAEPPLPDRTGQSPSLASDWASTDFLDRLWEANPYMEPFKVETIVESDSSEINVSGKRKDGEEFFIDFDKDTGIVKWAKGLFPGMDWLRREAMIDDALREHIAERKEQARAEAAKRIEGRKEISNSDDELQKRVSADLDSATVQRAWDLFLEFRQWVASKAPGVNMTLEVESIRKAATEGVLEISAKFLFGGKSALFVVDLVRNKVSGGISPRWERYVSEER